jgi:hypothetical protein
MSEVQSDVLQRVLDVGAKKAAGWMAPFEIFAIVRASASKAINALTRFVTAVP